MTLASAHQADIRAFTAAQEARLGRFISLAERGLP